MDNRTLMKAMFVFVAMVFNAVAFGQNPEFYKFTRSLEAYKESFKTRSDVMLIDPNSEFLKYFKSPGGAKK